MLKMIQWWICFLQTCSFRLHKMLIDRLESFGLLCGLLWFFSHSDGTHSLQRIHCWASDVMQKLFWWRNKLAYIGWPEGEYILLAIFPFRLNYSFKLNNLLHNKQLKKTDRRVHLYPYVHVIIRKSTYILIN